MNPSQSQSSGYGMPTSGAQYGGSQQYGPPPNWNFASPSMGYGGNTSSGTPNYGPNPYGPGATQIGTQVGWSGGQDPNAYGWAAPPGYGQQMTNQPYSPPMGGMFGGNSGMGSMGSWGNQNPLMPSGGQNGNPAARGPAPWGGYGNQANQSNPATRGAAPNGGYGQQDFGPMPPSAAPGYGSGDNPAWMSFLGGAQGGSANPNATQILDQRYAGWLSGTGGAPPMWTSGGG